MSPKNLFQPRVFSKALMGAESQFQQYHPGQELVPGYTLVQLLGAGMEGEVWRARAAGGTSVAIKIVRSLSSVGGRKQLKALKTLRDIRHVNLCPLHCFWTKDANGRLLEEGEIDSISPESSVGEPIDPMAMMQTMSVPLSAEPAEGEESESREAEQLILVMGLGEGTLHDRLVQVRAEAGLSINEEADKKVSQGLSAAETIHYLRGAADAIDTLNKEYDLFHCDIKPQNILVVGGGAQVCDFGLANKVTGDLTKTQSMMFATLAYAAPEVLRKKYSRSVDQYSLATTYFEMRTGLLPFDITTEADVTMAKCTGKLDFSTVSKGERKVLKRAMQVDPEARYASCTEFINEIARASGVDSRPIPFRLAIAAACILVALTGIGVWQLRPNTLGIAATELLDNAVKDLDKFTSFTPGTTEDYELRLRPFRESIGAAITAWNRTDDPELRNRIRQFVTPTSAEFSQAIESQLAVGGLGDADSNQSITADLVQLGQLCDLETAVEDTGQLRKRVQQSLIHVKLLNQSPFDPTELSTLRQSIQGDPQVLSAVTLALMHGEEDLANRSDALADIALAKKLIDRKGRQTLPKWSIQKWDSMQDTLIPQLELASKDSRTDDRIRMIIQDGWPDILGVVQLNSLKAAISQYRFDDFQSETKAFIEDRSSSQIESLRNKAKLLDLLRLGLASPQNAADIFQTVATELDNDEALRPFIRSAMPTWVGEVARRCGTEQLTLEEAEVRYQRGIRLLEPDGMIPPPLNTLLLANAIRVGPPWTPELASRATAISRDDLSKVNQVLSLAVNLESVAMGEKPDRLGEFGIVGRVEESLRNESTRSDVSETVSPAYVRFLEGLAAWHARKPAMYAQAWKDLQSNNMGSDNRMQLGAARCQWIAMTLIDLATDESGVEDSDVLRRRFFDNKNLVTGLDRVEAATWWTETSDLSPQATERLIIQRLLTDAAKSDARQLRLPPELRDRLRLDSINDEDGQLYRAAFELSLARKLAQPTLQYALACLDVGLKNHPIDDSAWLTQVLAPTMQLVQPMATTGDQLDQDTLDRFCEYFLQTDQGKTSSIIFPADSESGWSKADWLEGLETSASLLARSASEKKEQLDNWLKACEYCQRGTDLRGAGWDAARLARFGRYVEQAEKTGMDDPRVSINRAHLDFYQALPESDSRKRIERLVRAETSYANAIEALRSSGEDPVALYNAYVRHANSLVSLAFEQPENSPQKKDSLIKSRKSAGEAKQMIGGKNLADQVEQNIAYRALGNACEDLAFYCAWSFSRSEQFALYDEAIAAFKTAVDKTVWGNSMNPRYCLARCSFRYHQSGGDVSLDSVKEAMGQFDENAAPTDQSEWLSWRAKISNDLRQQKDAIEDLRRAYDIVQNNRDTMSDSQQRDEIIWLYAALLANSSDDDDRKLALRVLDQQWNSFGLTTFWKALETRCKVFNDTEQFDRMVDAIVAVDSKRIADSLASDPNGTMRSLLLLSEGVRDLGSPNARQTQTRVDQQSATNCLKKLSAAVEQSSASIDQNNPARLYKGLVLANANSLTSKPLYQRVRVYLDALPESDPLGADVELLHGARTAMLWQFTQMLLAPDAVQIAVRDLPSISKQDRDRLNRQFQLLEKSGRPFNRDTIRNLNQAFQHIAANS